MVARQARKRVQLDAAGADGAEVRHRLDRLLNPVQEEGLAPEARRGVHANAVKNRIVHNAVWVSTGEANMRQRRDAACQQIKGTGAHDDPGAQA